MFKLFSNVSLRFRIIAGCLFILTFFAANALFSVNSIRSLEKTSARVDHTHNVLAEAASVLASAVDMETGMRGYLLAGKEEFLDPYNTGREVFDVKVATLKDTVSDNAAQVELLDEIYSNIHEWQDNVTEPTIALRREIGDSMTMNDMAILVGEANGKVYFDAFRGQIAGFVKTEKDLLEKRRKLESTEKAQWVEHTLFVIAEAENLLSQAVDMETGMRGYLLSGKDEFLEPYNNGATKFAAKIKELKNTVSDNPAQVEVLNSVEKTISQWKTEVCEPTIGLRREIGDGKTMDNMADVVAEARGKVYFDKFREQITLFQNRERVLMEERQETAISTATNLKRAIQFGAVSMMVVLILGGLFLIGAMVRPISDTGHMLKDIATGEGDLTKRLVVKSKDEVGMLAQYFNDFVGDLQKIIGKVSESSTTVVDSAEQLTTTATGIAENADAMSSETQSAVESTNLASQNINNVAAGVEEINANTNSVASASEQVSNNLTTVGAAVEEVSANMNGVATSMNSTTESVNQVANSVKEMAASLNEVSSNTSETAKISSTAASKANNTAEIVTRLGESAGSIDKVVDLITGIAEQTNLLALNATIEAASAGDAGKGFAVVANEVKELAKQTSTATDDIRGQVEEMQATTVEAVDAITEIVAIIEDVNKAFTTIAAAVEQQTATVQNVSHTVGSVAAGAQEMAVSVQEAARGAQEVAQNVEQATTGVNNIAQNVGELASATGEISQHATEASRGMNEVLSNVTTVSSAASRSKTDVTDMQGSLSDLEKLASELQGMVSQFRV